MVKHPQDRAERLKIKSKKDKLFDDFQGIHRAKTRIKEKLKDQETINELLGYTDH